MGVMGEKNRVHRPGEQSVTMCSEEDTEVLKQQAGRMGPRRKGHPCISSKGLGLQVRSAGLRLAGRCSLMAELSSGNKGSSRARGQGLLEFGGE